MEYCPLSVLTFYLILNVLTIRNCLSNINHYTEMFKRAQAGLIKSRLILNQFGLKQKKLGKESDVHGIYFLKCIIRYQLSHYFISFLET